MEYVLCPNLPEDTAAVIIGEDYTNLLEKPLAALGIEIISLPRNPDIDPRLASHADLSFLHLGGERAVAAGYLASYKERLNAYGLRIGFFTEGQGTTYPRDAQLNVCLLGQHAFGNEKVHRGIVEKFTNREDIVFHSVKQGYARCSVCVVDEQSIITSDRGVARSAQAECLQVLVIEPGYVELPGFTYGFLGGATFKIRHDCLAFTGSLTTHPDQDRILTFLEQRGISPAFLTDRPIFDIGSAIPIWEKRR